MAKKLFLPKCSLAAIALAAPQMGAYYGFLNEEKSLYCIKAKTY